MEKKNDFMSFTVQKNIPVLTYVRLAKKLSVHLINSLKSSTM